MTTVTTPSAADVLMELHRRGIEISIRGDRFSLRPRGETPEWLKGVIRQLRVELLGLLSHPRRRWKEQAEALLMTVDDLSLREDIRHLFDEREAIASVDGGLDDDRAGRLAYRELEDRLAVTGEDRREEVLVSAVGDLPVLRTTAKMRLSEDRVSARLGQLGTHVSDHVVRTT